MGFTVLKHSLELNKGRADQISPTDPDLVSFPNPSAEIDFTMALVYGKSAGLHSASQTPEGSRIPAAGAGDGPPPSISARILLPYSSDLVLASVALATEEVVVVAAEVR